MHLLEGARRVVGLWYVSLAIAVALGLLLGGMVFYKAYPGQPKIGVIDIPFSVITNDSAFTISAFLDYARDDPSIKAVVIKLSSPGGGAAPSEQLFLEVRRLREQKPVVVSLGSMAASGGYMLAVGANHSYARASSIVGSVGTIITFPGPLIPGRPSEVIAQSGPNKLNGGDRRDWIVLVDELRNWFAQLVVSQRGEKLRISPDELAKAKVYTGLDAVRYGLVDEIGTNTDAVRKAASLAGISHYKLVDVNEQVFRGMNERAERILGTSTQFGGDNALANAAGFESIGSEPEGLPSLDLSPDHEAAASIEALRRAFLPSGVGEAQEEALPGFPLRIAQPNIYFLYVGPSQ